MVLAFGWALDCHDGGLHLCPVHLDMGKGLPRTFYARRALDSFNPGQRVGQSLHQAEVASRNGFGWPQPDYDVLHGQFGHPVQLCQLHHVVVQQRRTLRRREL